MNKMTQAFYFTALFVEKESHYGVPNALNLMICWSLSHVLGSKYVLPIFKVKFSLKNKQVVPSDYHITFDLKKYHR